MISSDHVRLMARYNAWQNESLYREAGALGEEARRQERGAFFASIHGTLSHLVWGDAIWMHRFAGTPKPAGGIKDSASLFPIWNDLVAARQALDHDISAWAGTMDQDWLTQDLGWFSGALGRDVRKPNWLLVTHFFNHQTHHRGQVHAMITAAGGKPDDTDLPFMPDAWAAA
jgi:uncharacterized damage-inducible protein DinB